MNIQVFLTELLIVSLLTTLTTQGVKAIMKEFKMTPYKTTMASIVSVVLAAALSAGYAIVEAIPVTPAYIVCSIALAFLGFLCATNGYDKVKEALEQILGGKKK